MPETPRLSHLIAALEAIRDEQWRQGSEREDVRDPEVCVARRRGGREQYLQRLTLEAVTEAGGAPMLVVKELDKFREGARPEDEIVSPLAANGRDWLRDPGRRAREW